MRKAAIAACLTAVIGFCVWIASPKIPSLEEFNYDLQWLFTPGTRPDEALVVLMDEDSYRNRNQDLKRGWDRSLHAQLLEIVFAGGAKAVVFDVLFYEPSPDPAVDAALARAMNAPNRNVILAAKLAQSRIKDEVTLDATIEPIEPFRSAATHGIVDLPYSSDLALRLHNPHPNSLAAAVIHALGGTIEEDPRHRWINYYGRDGSLDSMSYDRALRPEELSPSVFSNKVVFVGQGRLTTTEGSNTDLWRTASTRWTRQLSPGVEIQATAFLNLWRRDWLERLPPLTELGAIVAAGLLAGSALSLVRPGVASMFAIIGVLAVATLFCALATQSHRWMPWLIIAAVQVPFALGWSALNYRRHAVVEQTHTLQIPDHTLIRRVGRGGYGEVWLAKDILGNYHAVKVVYRSDFAGSTPFDREFRGIEKFTPISRSHPGFVHILHVGKPPSDEYFFYIMEAADDVASGPQIDPTTYVPRTLARDISRQGRLPLAECIELGIDLAAALEHLHQHQLIHRDIKPSNIIFVNGTPKFADIGLVTEVAAQTEVSKIGTEGYIAPEGPGTPAADVFSLGMVLYEAGMGLDPQQFPELTTALQTEPNSAQLRELHNIILTACETEPQHRYRSASELRSALAELQDCLKSKGSV